MATVLPCSAAHWIDTLGLQPHPEGGFYRRFYEAPATVHPLVDDQPTDSLRSASTAIYYLLSGDDFSAFHRLKSDEVWHFYHGSSNLELHLLDPARGHQILSLGLNLPNPCPALVVPRETWFGARCSQRHPEAFVLVGCTVAPGFQFEDFEMAERYALQREFPAASTVIEELTRSPA